MIQAFVVLVGWGMSACSDPPVRPSTENILASPAACAEYCAEVQLACGDAGDGTSQYESSVACEAQCAGWAPLLAGETGDTAANTIGCRLHYARKINAETDPPQKEDLACQLCMFAGPTGGGVCGSWCDTYCHLATFNCGGTSPLHADVAACQAACDEMFCVGQPFSEEFDSVQCRITHAGLAGAEPDESH